MISDDEREEGEGEDDFEGFERNELEFAEMVQEAIGGLKNKLSGPSQTVTQIMIVMLKQTMIVVDIECKYC